MGKPRVALRVPDLGLRDARVTVGQWLVAPRQPVTAGERLVELLAAGVTVDLPAPITGRIVRILASEDDVVAVGQTLCWIAPDTEPAED